MRELALTMAERLPEDPWRLNRASFEVVRQPGLDAARYRLALRHAEAARDLAHPGFYFDPATTPPRRSASPTTASGNTARRWRP